MFGYNREEFKIQAAIDNRIQNGIKIGSGKLLKREGDIQVYSYQHDENYCYYCIVNATDANINTLKATASKYGEKRLAYYRALAREKNNLVKVSDYINSSGNQYQN